ncbi:GAF and ANTAR domain-containing protein [Ornithinimicrobium sufpigmenti]|uniref:GAF and ANTAR domain-containing protein n=1 Tax=Ornithinimicrobium sufpigmenti TaxID=2508882 RepID=UPI0010365C90|nr:MULTISPECIES: GAF and ANTAR domain-containing protein [unclassified Ornithinimicrobium]
MRPTPRRSPAQELAAATSALVRPYDITDILAGMLSHCLTATGAEAAAVLVVQGSGQLELLSSNTHAASGIEIHQSQTQEGPCVDCIRAQAPVAAHGEVELAARWPELAPAMTAAGYQGVHAQPMLWHGRALGGVNLFFDHAQALSDDARALAQVFGDIATLALVQTQQPSDRELNAHITQALEARTLVEHAKGVLMHAKALDPGGAYTALTAQAREQGLTVTEMARNLVWRAHSR